jgi:Flp pilus assembly protein TadB
MNALYALLGAGLGGAVLLIVSGLRARPRPERGSHPHRQWVGTSAIRVAGVLAAAALVGSATGWPVAAGLAGVAAWTLPTVLGPDRGHRRTLARVEAIAGWAEDLAGTLRAGAGIEQAIWQTATVAAPEIRPELDSLAEALKLGVRLPDALRGFAADLADPTADMVVNVLLQAAAHQARDIAVSLAGVGHAARRQASARIRVATGRARTRTSTRIVITVVVGAVVLLVTFAADFLHPYSSPAGQAILAVLGGMFGGCLAWMVRTSQVPDLPRILTGPETGGTP